MSSSDEQWVGEDESEQLVEEYYPLDEELFEELACSSEYWAAAFDFWLKVKQRAVSSLTEKQKNWLDKIKEHLKEKGIKNEYGIKSSKRIRNG